MRDYMVGSPGQDLILGYSDGDGDVTGGQGLWDGTGARGS